MTDIEYSLNAFPLGGYVSFPEEEQEQGTYSKDNSNGNNSKSNNRNNKNGDGDNETVVESKRGLKVIFGNSTRDRINRNRNRSRNQNSKSDDNSNNNNINNNNIKKSDPDLLRNRPFLDRMIVIIGGVVANLVCALMLLILAVGTVGEIKTDDMPGVKVNG